MDAIWFSPLYPSPNADFGYDVADYKDINPEYGDLEAVSYTHLDVYKRQVYCEIIRRPGRGGRNAVRLAKTVTAGRRGRRPLRGGCGDTG